MPVGTWQVWTWRIASRRRCDFAYTARWIAASVTAPTSSKDGPSAAFSLASHFAFEGLMSDCWIERSASCVPIA